MTEPAQTSNGGPPPPLQYRQIGDIAVLIIDNPPVNALSLAVRTAIVEALRKTDADPAVKAVVRVRVDHNLGRNAPFLEP